MSTVDEPSIRQPEVPGVPVVKSIAAVAVLTAGATAFAALMLGPAREGARGTAGSAEVTAVAVPGSGGWSTAVASWYGPGLYGNRMACGGRLTTSTYGTANRWLRCGTRLTICLRGCARIVVVDRGPFVGGRTFDVTAAAARAIGLSGVRTVRWKLGW